MAATCFPYGFPTSNARIDPALGRSGPHCTNAEPGTFGHECGRPAAFIGTKAKTGAQACFCASCKETDHDAPGPRGMACAGSCGARCPLTGQTPSD